MGNGQWAKKHFHFRFSFFENFIFENSISNETSYFNCHTLIVLYQYLT